MDKQIVFAKNDFGISIVKCCASCKHKKCDNRVRLCMFCGCSVLPNYLCDGWAMAEGLQNAGRGDGMVKKRRYLMYASDILFGENQKKAEAAENNIVYLRKPIEVIRKEYEKSFGSIFENI